MKVFQEERSGRRRRGTISDSRPSPLNVRQFVCSTVKVIPKLNNRLSRALVVTAAAAAFINSTPRRCR